MSIELNIQNETATLKSVILGTAKSNGKAPSLEEAYDPKSKEHIVAGTYPKESDMILEMEGFATVLEAHGVQVYRPKILTDCNQIFSRDIAFVIEDTLIKSNILPDREAEFGAIDYLVAEMNPKKVLHPPAAVHVEGGDVMPWNDYVFIGTYTQPDYASYITARTNQAAVDFIRQQFPHKKVKAFELKKSNTDPRENALHLDCCFQPVGTDMAIIHKEGFLIESEYQWLKDFFGADKVFEISKEEMYQMNSNIFSISPSLVVSDLRFTRLNAWLESRGIEVAPIKYSEIAKQEGLLRCSTLPLIRD
ncbi:MAG: arginine deiminase family protein [Flavobacteriia bacterium]|nr:arginine deiminase family protein [Flavobacteriia bacterium]